MMYAYTYVPLFVCVCNANHAISVYSIHHAKTFWRERERGTVSVSLPGIRVRAHGNRQRTGDALEAVGLQETLQILHLGPKLRASRRLYGDDWDLPWSNPHTLWPHQQVQVRRGSKISGRIEMVGWTQEFGLSPNIKGLAWNHQKGYKANIQTSETIALVQHQWGSSKYGNETH